MFSSLKHTQACLLTSTKPCHFLKFQAHNYSIIHQLHTAHQRCLEGHHLFVSKMSCMSLNLKEYLVTQGTGSSHWLLIRCTKYYTKSMICGNKGQCTKKHLVKMMPLDNYEHNITGSLDSSGRLDAVPAT